MRKCVLVNILNGARLMKMQADALNSAGIDHQIVGDETLG